MIHNNHNSNSKTGHYFNNRWHNVGKLENISIFIIYKTLTYEPGCGGNFIVSLLHCQVSLRLLSLTVIVLLCVRVSECQILFTNILNLSPITLVSSVAAHVLSRITRRQKVIAPAPWSCSAWLPVNLKCRENPPQECREN